MAKPKLKRPRLPAVPGLPPRATDTDFSIVMLTAVVRDLDGVRRALLDLVWMLREAMTARPLKRRRRMRSTR